MGLDIIQSTIVWILIIGTLTFIFRKRIARAFKIIPLPNILLYFLVATIYTIIEENINCPPTQLGGCQLIPITVLFFLILLIFHFIIIKIFRIKNFYLAISIFGIIGWINEFLLGSHKTILWSAPNITLLMTPWVFLTYAIIVIIPTTLLIDMN